MVREKVIATNERQLGSLGAQTLIVMLQWSLWLFIDSHVVMVN